MSLQYLREAGDKLYATTLGLVEDKLLENIPPLFQTKYDFFSFIFPLEKDSDWYKRILNIQKCLDEHDNSMENMFILEHIKSEKILIEPRFGMDTSLLCHVNIHVMLTKNRLVPAFNKHLTLHALDSLLEKYNLSNVANITPFNENDKNILLYIERYLTVYENWIESKFEDFIR